MVKRMNESFNDLDHKAMKDKKDSFAKELGLKKLSWEKYLLHLTEIRPLKKD